MGATSSLIGGGRSGGVLGFLGGSEEILGFGARGGLDLGRWSFSLDGGDERGVGEVGGGDGAEAVRGGSSEWLLWWLEAGLAGGLLASSSASHF